MIHVLKIAGIILGVIICLIAIFLIVVYVTGKGSKKGTVPEGYQKVSAGDYEFVVKTEGDPQNTPVILLHGFPESSAMWEPFMKDLAAQGYYCAAYNQRGYSPGARPGEVDQYKVNHLASDVIEVANALGFEKFHLIGHDWGSGVGWAAAAAYPDRLISFTALSVPHLDAWSKAYSEDEEQYNSSAYIRQFQTPLLAEFMLAKNDYAALKTVWHTHSDREINAYLEIIRQKGALTAVLNWYRANYSLMMNGFNLGKVSVPTLFIWGSNDRALKRRCAELTGEYVNGPYSFIEIEKGHFLVQEDYKTIINEVLNHLSQYK